MIEICCCLDPAADRVAVLSIGGGAVERRRIHAAAGGTRRPDLAMCFTPRTSALSSAAPFLM
jgi:hypothetical protein